MNAHLIQNWVYKYRISALSSFKNSCLYNFVQMRYQIIFLKISAANAYKTVTNLLSFDFKPFFLALFCIIGAIPAPGIFFLWYLVQCFSGDGIKKSLQGNGEGAFPLGLDGFLLLLFSLPLITSGLRDTCWDRTFSKTHHYPCGQLPGYWSVGDPVVHAF